MAETIPSFDFQTGSSKYPWHEWLDGRIWKLTYKVDFTTTPVSFVETCRAAARRNGNNLRTSVNGSVVVIQAIPRESE